MAASPQRLEAREKVIVPDAVTLELYRKMLTVFYIEERMKAFVRHQGETGNEVRTLVERSPLPRGVQSWAGHFCSHGRPGECYRSREEPQTSCALVVFSVVAAHPRKRTG
jgi:hypothetical protein